jgi:hypothetical protein
MGPAEGELVAKVSSPSLASLRTLVDELDGLGELPR